MSTELLLLFAVGVFSLMMIGIIMTAKEFDRIKDQDTATDQTETTGNRDEIKAQPAHMNTMHLVHSKRDSA